MPYALVGFLENGGMYGVGIGILFGAGAMALIVLISEGVVSGTIRLIRGRGGAPQPERKSRE